MDGGFQGIIELILDEKRKEAGYMLDRLPLRQRAGRKLFSITFILTAG